VSGKTGTVGKFSNPPAVGCGFNCGCGPLLTLLKRLVVVSDTLNGLDPVAVLVTCCGLSFANDNGVVELFCENLVLKNGFEPVFMEFNC